METCWLPAFDGGSITPFIEAMTRAISQGCALFTTMRSLPALPPTPRPSGSAAIATGVALALPHAVDRI